MSQSPDKTVLCTACDKIGGAAHKASAYHDWWGQSLCWGCQAFEKSKVSLIFFEMHANP